MSSSGPARFSWDEREGPYTNRAAPISKARAMGRGNGADDTDEQDMPNTIEELQQRVREQKNVIRAAQSSYTQGYVKGRMDEAQRMKPIIDQMKIDYNDAVVKGKMLEYERLNELERVRLEHLRREIEDKLAQNYIL